MTVPDRPDFFHRLGGLDSFDRLWPSSRPRPRQLTLEDLQRPVLDVVLWLGLLGHLLMLRVAPPRLELPAREVSRVVPVVLGALAFAWTVVPHAPWHSNLHGIDRAIAVLDGASGADVPIAHVHGEGWFAVVQAVGGLSFGLLDPFAVTALLSALSCGVWFLFARLWTGRSDAALLAIAALAWWPVHLRLMPTVSMYVVSELLLGWVLLDFLVHLRTGDRRWFALALAPLFLLVHTRGEMMAVAPLAAAWLIASERPRWFIDMARSPMFWAALLGFVALWTPG